MDNKVNVFFLPFAGASFFSYNKFIASAPNHLTFLPIELPGRGKRINERLLYDLHSMVDDIFGQLSEKLTAPYAFYGHSMGSLLGYLLVKRIVYERLPVPNHFFVSGAKPPSLRDRTQRHKLPKKEFMNELYLIGGTTREVLEDSAVMDFFEPILRADFQATEKYQYIFDNKINIPITSMIGTSEDITLVEAKKWDQETEAPVNVIEFPGNHFFIFDHTTDIVRLIESQLTSSSLTP